MWISTRLSHGKKANDQLTEFARLEYGSFDADWAVSELRRELRRLLVPG